MFPITSGQKRKNLNGYTNHPAFSLLENTEEPIKANNGPDWFLCGFANKEHANFKYSPYWALDSDPKDMFCEQMVI